MVIAYHCIFGLYGFWLPNDPRGSRSDYVAAWELWRYGPATKTRSRHSVAAAPHDHRARTAAKAALRYPPVALSGRQARGVAIGFKVACRTAGYRIHACAILPDHVHLVVARHERPIRQIVGHLKSQATRELKELGDWSDDDRPLWGGPGWNVYLDNPVAVRRAIRYVAQNPLKEGKPPQRWSFVTPFDPSASQATRRNGFRQRQIGGAALASVERKRQQIQSAHNVAQPR